MRVSKRAIALAALPALTLADDVHLVDFPPRLSDLSSACQTVYTDTIGGCSSTDFTSGQCSAGCVNALQALQPVVIKACANQGITGSNVIVAFLNSEGPNSICSNADDILGGGGAVSSSSSSAPANTATLISQPSPTLGSTSVSATLSSSITQELLSTSSSSSALTTSTSAIFSGTQTVSTAAPSTLSSSIPGAATSSGVLVASSSAPSKTPDSVPSATSTDDPAETANNHSGGGSPFDGQGNSGARTFAASMTVSLLLSFGWVFLAAIR